ncbi:agmatine deiminase family protein [Chondromyces apiculatus]|uniref:Agmatine deiminase n=1 Tax=Chondromyces apiculatus DSM 436 TaxID=1192034 RepID=A0A017T704_9BACT|nr:agmatine deiminase family protein [Chondromyces apiculatus]EYF04376.1 Agmatine deiminase [Chondromyces apiculatus DSM 436]
MNALLSLNVSAWLSLVLLGGTGQAHVNVNVTVPGSPPPPSLEQPPEPEEPTAPEEPTEPPTEPEESTATYRFPAEWEPQKSLWIAWPTYDSTQDLSREEVYLEIVAATAGHIELDVVVATEDEVDYVEDLLDTESIPRTHVRLRVIPSVMDVWLRDTGPMFLQRTLDGVTSAATSDFGFNSWGYEGYTSIYPWDSDVLDNDIATTLGVTDIRSSPMISEGGAIESNGKGTMFITEAVALQRNPGMTKAQIEAVYEERLGMKKIIWLAEGVPEDDLTFWRSNGLPSDVYTTLTVGGHTDEFVRFIDEDTVLLAEVTPDEAEDDPIAAEARSRLEAVRAVIDAATTYEGHDIDIIRVPAATLLYKTMGPGDSTYDYITSLAFDDSSTIATDASITTVLATSYMNYVIANDVILMPAYWKTGRPTSILDKDDEMEAALEAAFPTRTVVRINPEALNAGGGGLHCVTQQQPY